MRIDWELIRHIMLVIEDSGSHLSTSDVDIKGYGSLQLKWHISRLYHEGMIDAIDARAPDDEYNFTIKGLTFDGDNLLSLISSKAIWEEIRSISKKAGISISFITINAMATKAFDRLIKNI